VPQFINGPKDGGEVPPILWVLDQIEMIETRYDGVKMIHCYELNQENKNYYYAGDYYAGGENE
jgi:hypothetical protein